MSIPDFVDAMVRLYNELSDEGKADFFKALFLPIVQDETKLHPNLLWFLCLVYARARMPEKYPSLSWHISDEDSVQIQHAKEKQNLENAFQMRFDSSQFHMSAETTRYVVSKVGGRVRKGGKSQPFKSYGDYDKFIAKRKKVFSKANLHPQTSIQKAIEQHTKVVFENYSFVGLDNFCLILSKQMKDFLSFWQQNSIVEPMKTIIKKHGTKIPPVFKMFFGNDQGQAATALQEIHQEASSQRQRQLEQDDEEMVQSQTKKKTTKIAQQPKVPKPRGRPRKAGNEKKWQHRDELEKKQAEALTKIFHQIPLSDQKLGQSEAQLQQQITSNNQTSEEQFDENQQLIFVNQEDERQFFEPVEYNMEDSIDVTLSKRTPRQDQPQQEQFPDFDKPLSQIILNFHCQNPDTEIQDVPDFLNLVSQASGPHRASQKNTNGQIVRSSQQFSLDAPPTATIPKEKQAPVNLSEVTYDMISNEIPKNLESPKRLHPHSSQPLNPTPVKDLKKQPTKKSKKPEPASSDDEVISSSSSSESEQEGQEEKTSCKKNKKSSKTVQVACTLTIEQLTISLEFFKMVRDLENHNMINDSSQLIAMFHSLANTFLTTGNTDPAEFARNTQIFWEALPNAASRDPSRASSQHASDTELPG